MENTKKLRIIREPTLRLVAETAVDRQAIHDYFTDLGLEPAPNGERPSDRLIGEGPFPGQDLVELSGRMCYQSWEKGRNQKDFIRHILEVAHGNLLAHVNVTILIHGVSRSLSHELIRHHVGTNPSQESQRYVTQDFANFVAHPLDLLFPEEMERGIELFRHALAIYKSRRMAFEEQLAKYKLSATERRKRSHEAARSVLPNCAETRLAWTMNLRAARNILEQRGDLSADLEIRRFAVAALRLLSPRYPEVFHDFTIHKDGMGFEFLKHSHKKV